MESHNVFHKTKYIFLLIHLYTYISYLIRWKERHKCDEITSSALFLSQSWDAQFVLGTAYSLMHILCSNLSSTWVTTFSSRTNWEWSYGSTSPLVPVQQYISLLTMFRQVLCSDCI